jgi:hypothetical protein
MDSNEKVTIYHGVSFTKARKGLLGIMNDGTTAWYYDRTRSEGASMRDILPLTAIFVDALAQTDSSIAISPENQMLVLQGLVPLNIFTGGCYLLDNYYYH